MQPTKGNSGVYACARRHLLTSPCPACPAKAVDLRSLGAISSRFDWQTGNTQSVQVRFEGRDRRACSALGNRVEHGNPFGQFRITRQLLSNNSKAIVLGVYPSFEFARQHLSDLNHSSPPEATACHRTSAKAWLRTVSALLTVVSSSSLRAAARREVFRLTVTQPIASPELTSCVTLAITWPYDCASFCESARLRLCVMTGSNSAHSCRVARSALLYSGAETSNVNRTKPSLSARQTPMRPYPLRTRMPLGAFVLRPTTAARPSAGLIVHLARRPGPRRCSFLSGSVMVCYMP